MGITVPSFLTATGTITTSGTFAIGTAVTPTGTGAIVLATTPTLVFGSNNTIPVITATGGTGPFLAQNSSLTTGGRLDLMFGRDRSSFNLGVIDFNYKALNSSTNTIGFGFFGANNVVTINGTGQVFVSSLTASQAVQTDASKNLVSVANTGTGLNVMQTNPTLIGPNIGTAVGADLYLSGLTANRSVHTDVASKLISIQNSGTGLNVMQTSPTLVTPDIGAASGTSLGLSGSLSTFTSGLLNVVNTNTSPKTSLALLAGSMAAAGEQNLFIIGRSATTNLSAVASFECNSLTPTATSNKLKLGLYGSSFYWTVDGAGNTLNPGFLRMSDTNIYLRGGSDNNHGLKWNTTYDGPDLYGFTGGALSYRTTPRLQWNSTGVSVNGPLTVNGVVRKTVNWALFEMTGLAGLPTNVLTVCGNWGVISTSGDTLTYFPGTGDFRNDLGRSIYVTINVSISRDGPTGLSEYKLVDNSGREWAYATASGNDYVCISATIGLNPSSFFSVRGFQTSGFGTNFQGGRLTYVIH